MNSFLTSALDWRKWPPSRLGRFNPWETTSSNLPPLWKSKQIKNIGHLSCSPAAID
jgi:hypothetical protein